VSEWTHHIITLQNATAATAPPPPPQPSPQTRQGPIDYVCDTTEETPCKENRGPSLPMRECQRSLTPHHTISTESGTNTGFALSQRSLQNPSRMCASCPHHNITSPTFTQRTLAQCVYACVRVCVCEVGVSCVASVTDFLVSHHAHTYTHTHSLSLCPYIFQSH
jgi:hypothetical protein